MKYGWIAILCVCGCNAPVTPPNEKQQLSDQYGNFEFPQEVLERAPNIRKHLLQLLHFDTPTFQVKPQFAFIDDDDLVQGPFSTLVTHYTYFHVVLRRETEVVWTGSLIMDPDRGVGVSSKSGYQWDIIPETDHYRIELATRQNQFTTSLDRTIGDSETGELGDLSVYVTRFVLPNEHLFTSPKTPE
ncbi:MAG: hypothetical protein KDC35_15630 [Acidobacteria bacterium]|nr:hypothetical protein [Acidobacteriota bacterium]